MNPAYAAIAIPVVMLIVIAILVAIGARKKPAPTHTTVLLGSDVASVKIISTAAGGGGGSGSTQQPVITPPVTLMGGTLTPGTATVPPPIIVDVNRVHAPPPPVPPPTDIIKPGPVLAGFYTDAQISAVRAEIAKGTPRYVQALAALEAKVALYMADVPKPMANYAVPSVYTDPAGFEAAVGAFTSDADAAEGLGLYYALTGKASAASKVVEIIGAYATGSKSCVPHEVKQPNGTYVENDAPLSMAELGAGLILGAELIDAYPGLTAALRLEFVTWVKNVYIPACVACYTNPTMVNNWADWGVWGEALGNYHAFGTIAPEIVDQLLANIDHQIAATGAMPEEDSRITNGKNSSIWYRYFALAPMTAACRLVYNVTGKDLFTYRNKNGATIATALGALLPLAQHPPAGYNVPTGYYPWDLFEAMASEYGTMGVLASMFDAAVAPHRPVQAIGHHHAWTYPTLTMIAGH